MKSTLLLASIFFLTLHVKAQKIDTTTSFDWDTTAHQFIYSAQQIFNYNAACYLTRYTYSFWDSAANDYIKYYRSTNNLLGNNATSQTLVQLWDDGNKKWDNYQKGIFTYTLNPTLPSSVLYQNWVSTNSSWINSRKYTYTYDASGNTTSIITQQWNISNSSWNNLFQDQYAYTPANKVSSFLQQNWDVTNNNWINFNLVNYTYNASNNLIVDSGEKWNNVSSNWVSTYKSQYLYNNNFLTTWNYNVWDTTSQTYLPNQQYIYTNNLVGNPVEILTLNWNEIKIGWDTASKDVNHYNGCILPLNLISFNAIGNNEKVNLCWQTTNEINVDYFNVQKLANSSATNNNNDFINIGQLPAKKISSSYLYQDDLMSIDKSITSFSYRLEIVDKNGDKTYSEIKQISNKAMKELYSVYPNPSSSYINIQGNDIKEVSIKDFAGKILINNRYKNALSQIHLPIVSLKLGVYFLQIINNNGAMHIEKILVQ